MNISARLQAALPANVIAGLQTAPKSTIMQLLQAYQAQGGTLTIRKVVARWGAGADIPSYLRAIAYALDTDPDDSLVLGDTGIKLTLSLIQRENGAL